MIPSFLLGRDKLREAISQAFVDFLLESHAS